MVTKICCIILVLVTSLAFADDTDPNLTTGRSSQKTPTVITPEMLSPYPPEFRVSATQVAREFGHEIESKLAQQQNLYRVVRTDADLANVAHELAQGAKQGKTLDLHIAFDDDSPEALIRRQQALFNQFKQEMSDSVFGTSDKPKNPDTDDAQSWFSNNVKIEKVSFQGMRVSVDQDYHASVDRKLTSGKVRGGYNFIGTKNTTCSGDIGAVHGVYVGIGCTYHPKAPDSGSAR